MQDLICPADGQGGCYPRMIADGPIKGGLGGLWGRALGRRGPLYESYLRALLSQSNCRAHPVSNRVNPINSVPLFLFLDSNRLHCLSSIPFMRTHRIALFEIFTVEEVWTGVSDLSTQVSVLAFIAKHFSNFITSNFSTTCAV